MGTPNIIIEDLDLGQEEGEWSKILFAAINDNYVY